MKNTTAKTRIKPFKPAKSRLRKDMYVSPSKKQGASFLMGIILGGSYLVYSEYRVSAVVDAYNDSISTPVQCLERQSRDLSTPNTKGEPHKQSFSIVPKAQAYELPRKTAKITAYSCGGLKTQAEINMNCPSLRYAKNGRTASGTTPVPYKTVACDSANMGKEFNIDGIGIVKCEDTGGAIKGSARFDLYVETVQEARKFGVQHMEYTEL